MPRGVVMLLIHKNMEGLFLEDRSVDISKSIIDTANWK